MLTFLALMTLAAPVPNFAEAVTSPFFFILYDVAAEQTQSAECALERGRQQQHMEALRQTPAWQAYRASPELAAYQDHMARFTRACDDTMLTGMTTPACDAANLQLAHLREGVFSSCTFRALRQEPAQLALDQALQTRTCRGPDEAIYRAGFALMPFANANANLQRVWEKPWHSIEASMQGLRTPQILAALHQDAAYIEALATARELDARVGEVAAYKEITERLQAQAAAVADSPGWRAVTQSPAYGDLRQELNALEGLCAD